jgi:alpha-L-fucosidase
MLNKTCGGLGNLLLNVGPAPDGSIPDFDAEPLRVVGKWLKRHGEAVYGKLDQGAGWGATVCGGFSYKKNKAYFWCRGWPGREIYLGNFQTRLRSASLLATGRKLDFEQKGPRIILRNLPRTSPDRIAGYAVIVLEFVSKPKFKRFATTPAMTV